MVSILAAAVVSAGFVLFAGAGEDRGGDEVRTDCSTFSFDAQAWEAWLDRTQPHDGPSRAKQAAGVVDCETFVGLSRRRVEALLGRADEREPRKQLWIIGADRDFGVHAVYLIVTFNRNGRAQRTHIA